jgi:hypothetical protein
MISHSLLYFQCQGNGGEDALQAALLPKENQEAAPSQSVQQPQKKKFQKPWAAHGYLDWQTDSHLAYTIYCLSVVILFTAAMLAEWGDEGMRMGTLKNNNDV